MTREEAIRILEEERDVYIPKWIKYVKLDFFDRRWVNALELAIKALEQEPCDDAISRQAVLDYISDNYRRWFINDDAFMQCMNGIKDIMVSVTPQPKTGQQSKTGHWCRKTKVDAYDIAGVKTWGIKCQCDRCDFTTIVVEDFGYYKYCPNCGAKMESEDKE